MVNAKVARIQFTRDCATSKWSVRARADLREGDREREREKAFDGERTLDGCNMRRPAQQLHGDFRAAVTQQQKLLRTGPLQEGRHRVHIEKCSRGN